MIRVPRKKIIFVLVEGPSDEEALGVIFNRIFDKNSVYVHIMRCDITTVRDVGVHNILLRVGDAVRSYASNNHFKKTDFQQIIHIVDMDGAFIPNEHVIEDQLADRPFYSVTEIRTKDTAGIVRRNKQKRENIGKLVPAGTIWNIPYRVFYMSCNLDHALYNKLNSGNEAKENDSYEFALKYRNNIPAFLSFISTSDFSVMTGYVESWEFIKAGLHSLERYSNLGLCFTDKCMPEDKQS